MRITYTPEQTRRWDGTDLAALVGMYVRVTPTGSALSHDGICDQAGIGRFGNPFVTWDDGDSVDWQLDNGAHISVCDEHGDHTSLNGVDCADRFLLAVQGRGSGVTIAEAADAA